MNSEEKEQRMNAIGKDLQNQHLPNYTPSYKYTNEEVWAYWKRNPMKSIKDPTKKQRPTKKEKKYTDDELASK